MSLGLCPQCGVDVISREKRPDGNDVCRNGHEYPSSLTVKPKPRFYCPICGAPEASRERRPNGNSHCESGHPYASAAALDEPSRTFVALNHVPAGGSQTLVLAAPSKQGPIAVAVASHMISDVVSAVFQGLGNAQHQGIVVIPFGASALAFAPDGTALFSALVAIPPRDGPVGRIQFDSWVAQALVPYLNPLAPRIEL